MSEREPVFSGPLSERRHFLASFKQQLPASQPRKEASRGRLLPQSPHLMEGRLLSRDVVADLVTRITNAEVEGKLPLYTASRSGLWQGREEIFVFEDLNRDQPRRERIKDRR